MTPREFPRYNEFQPGLGTGERMGNQGWLLASEPGTLLLMPYHVTNGTRGCSSCLNLLPNISANEPRRSHLR